MTAVMVLWKISTFVTLVINSQVFQQANLRWDLDDQVTDAKSLQVLGKAFAATYSDREKRVFSGIRNSDPKTVFNMDYFICPSPNSRKVMEPPGNSRLPSQVVPLPIDWEPTSGGGGKARDDDLVKGISKVPIEISVLPSAVITERIKAMEADQDAVSQVFFKMKENEFVDMKMDSPKSGARGILPQIETFQFEEKGEALESKTSPRMKIEKEMAMGKKSSIDMDCDSNKEEVSWEETNGRLNIWKWSLSGIGAICSFGVAAATICIIFFGSHQRNKPHQPNQKLRFQIYTDDKRIKQVVQRATKFNEVISAARGVPMARAQITFGGYYDGL